MVQEKSMKKFSGSSFKLRLKIEAPVGGRAGTTTKLLKKLIDNTEYFTVNSVVLETHFLGGTCNILNITYHEPAKEEFIALLKEKN